MLCEKPFIKDGVAFACGQCLPCRHKRAKVWAHRIELEATQHQANSFVTLTYTDEWVRKNEGNLRTRDLTLFLKRLRKGGWKIRYYAVGEYGDKTRRPHYHLALFGEGPCLRGQTDLRRSSCCARCDFIARTWGMGAIQSARLEPGSAAYVAGYVTKKLSDPNDFRLGGRHPEFARMSKRPGIGANAIPDVADRLLRLPPRFLASLPDVPRALRHGGKPYPLGRYLTRLLRKQIGRSPDAPEVNLEHKKEEVQLLRQYAEENSGLLTFSQVYKSICLEVNSPAYERMVYKSNLRKRKRAY